MFSRLQESLTQMAGMDMIQMTSNLPFTVVGPRQDQAQKRSRRRVPVSCILCHTRKLKCNRQKPCSSCEIRGEASKCTYASKIPEENPLVHKRRRMTQMNHGLQQRLDNLERMVVDAANGQNGRSEYGSSHGTSNDVIASSLGGSSGRSELQDTDIGTLEARGPNTVYTGDTALHGILQEVGLHIW